MKIYTCLECGYQDLADKADNGNHEPPSCQICDSTQLVFSNNINDSSNQQDLNINH